MALSAMEQVSFYAAGANVGPSIPVVIITGLSLVFGILILLYLVLLAQGKVFQGIDAKKKEKLEKEQAAALAAKPGVQASPLVEPGIPPEVVAAIAAAVTAFGEGRYILQSVSNAAETPSRRGQWGFAGVLANTEPF